MTGAQASGRTRARTWLLVTASAVLALACVGCSGGDDVADGGLSGEWIAYEGPIDCGDCVDDGGAGNRLVRPDGTGDYWVTPDVPRRKNGWQVHPDWSPDGSRLAFAVDQEGESPPYETRDIWLSDADGSHAERVFDCALPCVESDDPAWSPDGKTLVFGAFDDAQGDADNVRLVLLDLESGNLTTLVLGEDDQRLRRPRWSPDGRSLVLEVQQWTDPGPGGALVSTVVATTSLDDPATVTPLTEPSAWATYPDWHPDDDLIVYSTRPWTDLETDPSNLFTIRPDGSGRRQVTRFDAGGPRAVQPSWTPDGDRIVFTRVEGTGFGEPTMATIRPDGTGLEPATSSGPMFGTPPPPAPEPVRRTPARPFPTAGIVAAVALTILVGVLAAGCGSDSSTGSGGWVVYSWDGTCGSSPPVTSDTQGLCLVRPDGTEPHRILLDLAESKKPDWSNDGRRLAFTAPDDTGAQRIWTSAADGSEAAPVETDADCDVEEGYPAWSPDDSEIAFMCLHGPEERADLDVVDLETGATRTVVAGTAERNAWAPCWSPDGSSLTFNLEHVTDGTFGGSVVATSPASGGAVTVITPTGLAYAGYPDWSPNGTSIVFATYGIGEFPEGAERASNLYAVAPDGSGQRQITRYAAGGPRAGWASWTPDGTQIVFTQVDEGGARRIAFISADGTGLRVVQGVRANMPRVQP